MTITAEQLEQIKAANHSKSLAWEAATFLPGDKVLSYGFTAVRSADGTWTYNDQTFETLSRWIRPTLQRKTLNVKRGVFLMVDSQNIEVGRLPPATKRTEYSPWTPGKPTFRVQHREPVKPVVEERSVDIEQIKAAKHAATVAWEAATFSPGDKVVSYGYGYFSLTAVRSADGNWIYNDQRFETLSRWARTVLKRKSVDVKRSVFLMRGNVNIPVGQLIARRRLPAQPARKNESIADLINSRFDAIAKRLDAIEARLSLNSNTLP